MFIFYRKTRYLQTCKRRQNYVIGGDEYLIPHKRTLKILYKAKYFPRRYKRKREWVFILNTVYI